MSSTSLQARVYYLIRFHDVELAEDFSRRCPDVKNISELNGFFHLQFTQYAEDSCAMRMGLVACDTFEQWSRIFVSEVLPSLCTRRFPPFTHLTRPSVYEACLRAAV